MPTIQPLAADDPARGLALVDPDDPGLVHLALGVSTYTILIRGADTTGRYALIDMTIPPGSGPPPHRHDFEEMFHVLKGEIQVTVRDQTAAAKTGETVNIPALAPHSFVNSTSDSVRLLCLVAPAGLEDYFAQFGDRVATRTAPAPELTDKQKAERMNKAIAVAAEYRIEVLD